MTPDNTLAVPACLAQRLFPIYQGIKAFQTGTSIKCRSRLKRAPVSAEADGATPIVRQETKLPLRPASVEMLGLRVVGANRVPAPAPACEPIRVGRRRVTCARHEFAFHLP